jgi:hypothetical protein
MSLALDAAELLFNCLANVDNGDWTQQPNDWNTAACNAREAYHAALDAERRGLGADVGGRPREQRILAVLRSDYELVLRLAADRLRTLDAAYPPETPPGSAYLGTLRSDAPDDTYARQAVETPSPYAPLPLDREGMLRDLKERADQIRTLEEQLADAERVAATLAREVDQLRERVEREVSRGTRLANRVGEADLLVPQLKGTIETWAKWAAEAERRAEEAETEAERLAAVLEQVGLLLRPQA